MPEHLADDEHHADWAGSKGYVATTVGGGCLLGVALAAAADDAHLREAYGVFAAEARDVDPEYAPATGNRPRPHDSRAHRRNGKRYHEHWLHNLMGSTSLMGFRSPKPAIR